MRFLVDTNLPRTLCEWLATKGHSAIHVLDLNMGRAPDTVVWAEATTRSAVVLSKDEDFADLVRRDTKGPSFVWIRTGNGTTSRLVTILEGVWSRVEARLEAGDRLVEVR